ncbi:methyltransferase family protein [Marinoscillum sp.]|uniref:methyltransferase family protein n=1 Tax=Marinoscillum sp. TaxID=2024838 RepID=UPI003BAB5068
MQSTDRRNKMLHQGQFLFKYRGLLPVIFLIIGLIIFFFQVRNSALFFTEGEKHIYDLSCLVLALFGLIIRVITVGYTPKGTSGRNTTTQVADQLNTTGLYAVTRNPLYLGNFLIWLAIVLLCQHIWFTIFFLLSFWWFYRLIIFTEETFLAAEFGAAYLTWKSNTPVFFPALGKYQPSTRTFNWKKVLRKEKNGVAAIFVIFFLFQLTRAIADDKDFHPLTFLSDHLFWSLCAIGSGLYYLLIKVISTSTNWLENTSGTPKT